MKKSISLLLIFFVSYVFAQKTVSGTIKDSDGDAVASASITIEETGKDAIIAYGISNAKGEYKINFTSTDPSVDLKIKGFNRKTVTQSIKNDTQTQNFTLSSETTEIKEIKLKTKLITKKGDTISYDLKSFESKSDRTLADVLKKIPGIEVNTDGSVLYQGEAINKFYVNGKDLMEGGYGTINNSLPKDAVSKVEVLENHQPIKILQDKVASQSAAINIKLKNKVTMTGRGEAGTGFGGPWLWNLKLTPMFFGQKNQWVVNYKTNNIGDQVENEANVFGSMSRFEGIRRANTQSDWLTVENATTPNIGVKRYLYNNVHYFSANLLTNPFKNKEWELKANTNYTNNAVNRASFVETTYQNTGLTVAQNVSDDFYTNKAKGELIFTKNAKKGFFKNTTTWNGYWNSENADVSRNTSLAGESLYSPTGSIQNSLSTIIPWKEKMVNLRSFVNYKKDRQTLVWTPASYSENLVLNNFDKAQQNLTIATFETSHAANIGFSYKKWTITPEVGLNTTNNTLETQLYGQNNGANLVSIGSLSQNNLTWNTLQPYGQVGVNYKGTAVNFNFNLPVNYNHITSSDPISSYDRTLDKVVFEPSFYGSYEFKSFWKLWGFGNMSYNFGNFGDIYTGNIYLSPSSKNLRFSQLPETLNKSLSGRLEYRNPLNNLFFNVGYNINDNKSNLITSTFINATGLQNTSVVEYDNNSKSQSERAEIGKYFPKFKTNISSSFRNTDSNSFQLYQEEPNDPQLIENTTNSQSLDFKLNNTYFKWMSFDYTISFGWSTGKNQINNVVNTSKNWSHNLSTYFYPIENHTIGFFWDDLSTSSQGQSYRNSFYDASYQYTWAKKKIDFELKWMNIANTKIYERINLDTAINSITTTKAYIRPSQVMFSVKFNFK